MKENILQVFIVFFLPTFLFSQSHNFEYTFFDSKSDVAEAAIQTFNDGYAIVINEIPQGKVNRIAILSLNKNGQLVSLKKVIKDSLTLYLCRLTKTKFGFLGVGGAFNTINRKKFLWLTKFDSSFNVISDQLHETPNTVQFMSTDTDRDSNIIIGAGISYPGSILTRLFGARVNKDGNLTYLTFKYPRDTTWEETTGSPYIGFFDYMRVMKDSQRYVLFDGTRLVVVDTNFNYQYNAFLPTQGQPIGSFQPSAVRVNDSIYFMGGRYNRNLYFLKTNLKGEHLVFKELGNGDTSQWMAIRNSIDTTFNGDIFIGGTFNKYYQGVYPFLIDSAQFVLYKLNKSYNTLWSRKYGKDILFDMYGLLATNDGGCLMYGLKYNYNPEKTTEAYILKVDGDGLITSETSIPLSITTTQLSPNPSSGGLVQTNLAQDVGETDIRFFDLGGRLIKTVHLTVPDQAFDVSDLPVGQYIFHVLDIRQRPLSMGKFVKI